MGRTGLGNTTRFLLNDGNAARPASVILQRTGDRNPLSPGCPLALRRICGVCAHFGGAEIRTTGACTKQGGEVRGTGSAADCADWTRKSVSGEGV